MQVLCYRRDRSCNFTFATNLESSKRTQAIYSERDKDELVFHSRFDNPFKTVSQTQSGLTSQKLELTL